MIKCLLISLSSLLQIVLQESFNIFKLRTVGGIFVPNAPTFVSQIPNNYMNKKKHVIMVFILFYTMETVDEDRVDVI